MRHFERHLQPWLPVFLVCALIFLLSQDSRSGVHSQAMLSFALSLVGVSSPHVAALLNEPARKLAHMVVYALLAIVSWRAFDSEWPSSELDTALRTLGFCFLYACSDEFHQRFVPTRGPSFHDVWLDTAAAALMLAVLTHHCRGLAATGLPVPANAPDA